MMDWTRLLTTKRLGKDATDLLVPYRSPFEVDMDRILFCSAFRRLADKMQVHGHAGNDMVRTRLTHSLEVSRVGRSLGAWTGRFIVELLPQRSPVTAADIGHIVASAAAAHDLGTPPFAHVGEDIVSDWFERSELGRHLVSDLPSGLAEEFRTVEGNAYGFRLLVALQGWRKTGGLQLTCATLGAFTKYPWGVENRTAKGKYGFMDNERALFREVAETCGLEKGPRPGTWARHPLAHLVEAADDICYSVVDLEDAVAMGCLSYAEVEELLMPLVADREGWDPEESADRKIVFLRSRAIDGLIREVASVFVANHDAILAGTWTTPLLEAAPSAGALGEIARISRERIYRNGQRLVTDLQACNVLTALLESYCSAFLEREESARSNGTKRLSARSRAILRSFPGADSIPNDRASWLRRVVDHIVGMTDGYAIAEARRVAA